MSSQKVITGNPQRQNCGTVAFGGTADGSAVTKVVGKTELNVTSLSNNTPVESSDAGTFKPASYGSFGYQAPTEFTMLGGVTQKVAGYTLATTLRSAVDSSNEHKSQHQNSLRYIRDITSWNYVTGRPTVASVSGVNFGRDDALANEFVFIPAGGRVPTPSGGNNKFYTYSRLY